MVNKNEIMRGDIIRLKRWAFEVLEIGNNSVMGRLLTVGVGSFVESWPKVYGYAITEDLLEALGYEQQATYNKNLWEFHEYMGEGSNKVGYTLSYDLKERTFAVLHNPTKSKGFCFAYATYLHELMHLYKAFKVDCSSMYKIMRDYQVPTELV